MNLSYFSQNNFYNSLKQFFSDLNIPINPVTEAPDSANSILSDTYNANNPAHKLMDDVYFVGMVSEDAFIKQREIRYTAAAKDIKAKDYDCMLLFGVTLKAGRTPSRSQLAEITRAFNRQFSYYPVVVIFKYGESIAFANCERLAYKQAWRAGEKAGKVSLLKDIAFNAPHTGHLKILLSLEIARFGNKAITTFAGLYKYWQEVFNVSILNKLFYQELSNWYFWALSEISFPDDSEKNNEVRTAENSIRLITRLIFVWFLKEKGLVPDELFDKKELDKLLDYRKDKTGSAYYRAILQNLFFATLNVPMDEREFRDEKFQGKNDDYMNHRAYRYADLFKKANDFESIFAEIPFLNGGLFDCLDYRDENGKEVRIDCYSDNSKNAARLTVPDKLFFGSSVVDLSEIYDDRRKNAIEVRGIIDILNSYKFTIAENTPVEEEIALDPELLGRVFENLLASYNPETQTTARKQTGSFYTPREIVNYMVDESLKAYLATTLGDDEKTRTILDQLLDYGDELPELTEKQLQQIIAALEDAKILDPACGSGAFPMGILQKMVRILEKLDPKNERWKQAIIKRTPIEARKEMESILEGNTADYSRKLGIIQNCIYGVDIQPIAIQVSKLRFFISLLVDFFVDESKHNLGIQPLPNLDYKLMQGNSLLEDFHGFTLNLKEQDTEEGSGHLFCENSKVIKLIEELWEKQGEYLRESRPKHKEKLRDEVERDIVNIFDTYIRQNMKEYFGALNSIENRAKQIPNEKPREDYLKAEKAKLDKRYNFDHVAIEKDLKEFTHGFKSRNFFPWQLYFADVFQKKGGFDIVIGNPPYIDSENMTNNMPEFRKILKDIYISAKGNWDIFVVFIEKGINLCNSKGSLSYIIPNKLVSIGYTEAIRTFMSNKCVLEIRDYSRVNVFEEAAVYPIVILVKNTIIKSDVRMSIMSDLCTIKQTNIIEPEIFYSDINWDKYFSDSANTNILLKMASNMKLGNMFNKILGAATVNEAYQIKEVLTEIGRQSKGLKFINTGTIDRYTSLWGNKKTQYIKGNYQEPFISEQNLAQINKTRLSQAKNAKIIIAGMAKIIEAYYDDGNYLAGKSTLIILHNDKELLKTLLGILNSKLISFWFQQSYKSLAMAGGYFNMGPNEIKSIPIPELNDVIISDLLKYVEKIIARKDDDITSDTTALESEIDRIVYDLYNLTHDEINVVESAL